MTHKWKGLTYSIKESTKHALVVVTITKSREASIDDPISHKVLPSSKKIRQTPQQRFRCENPLPHR